METRKSNNITATPTRKDNSTSNRPSNRKQGKGKKSKTNENYYAVFGRMADRTGEAQDTVDKTKKLGVELNTEREQTGKTSVRKEKETNWGRGSQSKCGRRERWKRRWTAQEGDHKAKGQGNQPQRRTTCKWRESQMTVATQRRWNTRHQSRTGL